MAIKHSTTKIAGQKIFAVTDWNADHEITGDVDMNGFKITELAEPTADSNGATKKYVDDSISAIPTAKLDDGTTTGQMVFWNGTKWTYLETSEVFWDDTNKRLGIGTNSPSYRFHISGTNVVGNYPLMYLKDTVLNVRGYMGVAGSNELWIGSESNSNVNFVWGDAPRMVLTSTGVTIINSLTSLGDISLSGGTGSFVSVNGSPGLTENLDMTSITTLVVENGIIVGYS